MKKTLIAAAALFAVAGAMADVTVTGTFDATLRMSDDGTTSTTRVGRDGSGTTGVIFKVNEDLGDGLKAIGLYEHDFNWSGGPNIDAGSSTNDGTGERYVGLQGGFGTIKLGTPNAPSLTIQSGLRGAPFGTKDGGRASAGGVFAGGNVNGGTLFGKSLTRYAGSIVYETPNFSGFSASIDYVPASEDQTGTSGTNGFKSTGAITDVGAFYRSGPIWAGVAIYTQAENEDKQAPEEQLMHLGVHYNFGFATFGLGYHSYTKDTAAELKNTGLNVLASVPLSEQLTLGVNYQTLTDDSDAGAGSLGDLTQIAVGVNYQLSKMTSVYARYVSADGDDLADPFTTMLAGLRVNF